MIIMVKVMKIITDYKEGDILEFKKNHPCGSKLWKVVKPGVDMKLECVGCGRMIIIPRVELNKKVKNIIRKENGEQDV